jgi:NADPH:quinone reductase-like Zn-dependent oxidoreductase
MREFFQVEKAGSLKNLKYSTSEIPALSKGKVLVEVKAIGLNYADLFAIMGLYSATPKGPFIPGLEFSGTVLETDCIEYPAGTRVVGVTRFGGYDSHIVADPRYLTFLPEAWSFQEGAAFPVQTLTAYYALLSLGNLTEGQTVLIHSGAGGVGLQANRIAKKLNACTIGVVGSPGKLRVLSDHGYDAGIVRSRNFKTDLGNALNGRELNLVLEASGGKYFKYSYDVLAPTGRLVAYGSAQFTPRGLTPDYLTLLFKYLFRPRVDPLSMITANKSVLGFNLIWLYEKHELMKKLLEEIGTLNLPAPVIGETLPFESIAQALIKLKSGNTIGKVVAFR